MKHIKALDTLRAFAVFFVIIQHWGPPIKETPTPFQEFFLRFFVPDGAFGVYLFFVLSGFLITGILLSARECEPTGKEKLVVVKNFIVRRVLRIFPIYYLTVFILYFYFPNIKPNLPYLLSYSLNVFSFQQNNFISSFSHSWTLCIEEQFYLLWPWLILFVNSRYLKYVFFTAIVTGILSTAITMGRAGIIEPFLVTDCLDAFGIGALYAYMRLNRERLAKFEKVIRYTVPFCLAAYFYWKIELYNYWITHGIWMMKTVVSIISVWLIMIAVKPRTGVMQRFFWENRVLNFIGIISYGIYLYHPYMFYMNSYVKAFIDDRIVHNPFWHDTLTDYYFLYGLNFAVLILICWLSYRLIEQPLLSLKKYFSYDHAVVNNESALMADSNQYHLSE